MSDERLSDTVVRQARERPEAIAVVDGERAISYAALDALSNRLGREFLETGARRGERVALLLDKSIEALAAMLAANKAGLVYVPLDPGSPPARASRILDRCRPGILLAGGRHQAAARELGRGREIAVGWLGESQVAESLGASFDAAAVAARSGAPLDEGAAPDETAHVLFTSGSTGTPKGVMVPHRTVLSFCAWANCHFGARPGERWSGHSPLHFDLSSFDIYGAFMAGAELHLVPPALNLLAPKLAAWIRERELDQWFSVPSILSYMARFDVVEPGDFPSLKRLLWCGEVFPTPPLRYWMQRLRGVPFTNLYGPTETTIASSFHTLTTCPAHDGEEVPIGRPCGGESLHVLGPEGRPLPPGETGDLYIGGEGLTLGYWEEPEKTAEVFVERDLGPGPVKIYKTGDLARIDAEGVTWFLGRADTQIKSRGYRIELGEIETALHRVEGLGDGAIVAIPSEGFEGHLICCAYVPRSAGLEPLALRKALSEMVPAYMIPSRWRAFERLPKTSNGKTDRVTLRALFAKNAERDG